MSATTDAEPRVAPFPAELLASGVSEDAFEAFLSGLGYRHERDDEGNEAYLRFLA